MKTVSYKKVEQGGYIFLLVLVLSSTVLLFLFFRVYLSPAPPLVPSSETFATSSQNRIEQAERHKADANRAARLMEGNNSAVNALNAE